MSEVATVDAVADAAHDAHHGPEHDYHLVDPSPWPLLTSFAAMIMVIMIVVTFQNKGGVYTGYAGNVWSNVMDVELTAYNETVAEDAPDFGAKERLMAQGARELEDHVLIAPIASVWTNEATQLAGDGAASLEALTALVGPGVSANDDGTLRISSSAAITCGAGSLFACELQNDGTFARAGFAYGFGLAPFLLGLTPLLFCMGMWWRDVVREAHVEGHHTPIVQLGLRYGMLLFIVSEIFFFVAFFWAFFANSLFDPWPSQEFKDALIAAGKDPKGAAFHPLGIPLYNTVILLLSGTTVTQAHEALVNGRREAFKNWLGITVLLGVLFTGVQVYEYTVLPFGFGTFDYGSTFYAATGFHGFHVLVGTLFLAVCWFRANQFKPDHHFGFEAAAWYWHFVDVVWVFLYVAIYWGLFVTNPTLH